MQPLISVCIPSFNNARFIQETIQSVIQQDYPNIELIICDDGSTDETISLIKQTIQNCPWPVKLSYSESNQGIEANWNHCLSQATGKYIKLLPGDDTLSPNCLSQQARILEKQDDIVLTFCARDIITRSGKRFLTARFYQDEKIASINVLERCILSGTNVIGEPGAVLFRQSASQKTGQFNGALPYVIDLNYWSRLLKHGNAYALSDVLCTFRIDSNLSVRLGLKRFKQYCQIIDTLYQQWQIPYWLCLIGKCRALLNEFLRRIVHIICRWLK